MSQAATPEGQADAPRTERHLSARAASQAITAELLERVSTQLEHLSTRLQQGESAELLAFMRFSARFHSYSLNNQLLIWTQAPASQYVAGFRNWLASGRSVKKGAKAVRILAPLTVKDPDAARTTEGKQPQKLVGFRYVSVFADYDTEGEPLPTQGFMTVPGGDEGHRALIDDLSSAVPVPVRWEDAPHTALVVNGRPWGRHSSAHGWTDGQQIVLNTARCAGQPAHALRVFFHEWAHAELHFTDNGQRPEDLPSRAVRELEADGAAYVLCAAYGIDATAQTADYVTAWGGHAEALQTSLKRIAKTVSRVQERIQAQQTARSAAD
ncbi:ArdC family protein [Deinococcus sp.]|uniref:ArdC family protein n=1 Tax=Deinococcus sp. TaxID=47478 RepID=UPI0025FD0022|nr:ArdC family protein [Deinococcus sp.]